VAASVDACAGQPCRRDRKCRRKGGVNCKCVDGRCRSAVCPCTRFGTRCSPLEPCGSNCFCFWDGHGRNPGHCIYAEDGVCETFYEKHGACPGGDDSECPDGKVCRNGGCACTEAGWPPLCAECCSGR
jgi:hypothetical protein